MKVAALRGDSVTALTQPHLGQPLAVLGRMLREPQFSDGEFFGVSGASDTSPRWPPSSGGSPKPRGRLRRRGLPRRGVIPRLLPLGRIPSPRPTTSAPPAAANSSSSRSGGWVSRSTRRSAARSPAESCRWRPAARPLQVGHHPQAQPPRGYARGHPAHAARQHGQQSRLAPREGQHEMRRVLLVGGLPQPRPARRLSRTRPDRIRHGCPESPWFDAWGCALLGAGTRATGGPSMWRARSRQPAPAHGLRRPGAHDCRRRARPPRTAPSSSGWTPDRRRPRPS